MIRTGTWQAQRMAEAAIADFSLATDAADLLARRGVPFREAHAITGKLVADCLAAGKTFSDLSDEEWAAAHPVFAAERPPLTAMESLRSRDVVGGAAPNRTAQQLAGVRDWLGTARAEVNARAHLRETMMAAPAS
jgi:argininosuccinate lyase